MAWCKLEDTYHDDPKWHSLAEDLGVEFAAAAGMAALIWSWAVRHAPDGNLGHDAEGKIAHLIGIHQDDREETIAALVRRQVLDRIQDGSLAVHGFAKRAERYLATARMKRHRKRTRDVTVTSQPTTRDASVTARDGKSDATDLDLDLRSRDLRSLVPDPTLLVTHDPSSNTPTKVKKTRRKRRADGARGAPPSGVAQVRDAWVTAFASRYGRECTWGARSNGQAAQMLREWSLERVLALIPFYFAWQRPEPIRAGHPFGEGPHSFAFRLRELDADTHAPERRASAAVLKAHDKSLDQTAEHDAQGDRVDAMLRNGGTDGWLRGITDPLAPSGVAARRDPQPANLGSGAGAVGGIPEPIRAAARALVSAQIGVRGRAHAVDRRSEIDGDRESGRGERASHADDERP